MGWARQGVGGGGEGAGGMGWREERDMVQHQHKQYIYAHNWWFIVTVYTVVSCTHSNFTQVTLLHAHFPDSHVTLCHWVAQCCFFPNLDMFVHCEGDNNLEDIAILPLQAFWSIWLCIWNMSRLVVGVPGYWVVQAWLLTPLTFTQHCLSPLAVFNFWCILSLQ